MLVVGVVEIVAYVVAAWLAIIIANLLLIPGYFDVALRDFGLFLGALALARLSHQFARSDWRGYGFSVVAKFSNSTTTECPSR